MASRLKTILWMIIFCFCLLLGNGNAGVILDRVTKTGTVRIGIPYNLTPQGFLKPTGEWTGFEVDLASELARHMNLKLEAVKVTESTWGPLMSRGGIDAAFCRIRHTRSLEKDFDFSVAYFFDSGKVMVAKGVFKKVSDLKGNKLAAVQGSSAERAAMNLLKSVGDERAESNVVSFPDRASCFMALGRGKVSGWLDSGLTLLEYGSKHPGRFELIDASDSVEPLAVALPSDDSGWRDLVNFTIQDMAADGSFDKIYDQWFGLQTLHPFPKKRPIEIWPE